MRNSLRVLALITFALTCFACEPANLLHDGSFDSWCGAELCDWHLDEGSIERISTWHRRDYGVSLAATPTQISQIASERAGACLRFTIVAEVDPEAQVVLEVDQGADSSIEFTQRVVGRKYERLEFVASFPASQLGGSRFILRKNGTGRAHFADFSVTDDLSCGAATIPYEDGASCTVDAQCKSGACVDFTCTRCASAPCEDQARCSRDEHCQSGSCTGGTCRACGRDGNCDALSPCSKPAQCASRACAFALVPSRTHEASEAYVCAYCADDGACAGKYCVAGACVDCRDDADCAAGTVCRYVDDWDALQRVCREPAARVLPRGALCAEDADCADGLSCGATAKLPKRCGIACAGTKDCGADALCFALTLGVFMCPTAGCSPEQEVWTAWPPILASFFRLYDTNTPGSQVPTCWSDAQLSR